MKLFSALVCAALLIEQVEGDHGVARFSEDGEERDYCIYYKADWIHLPRDPQRALRLETYNLTWSALCSEPDVPAGGFRGRLVMVLRGNCTFYQKVSLAQKNHAQGLLIISRDWLSSPVGNRTQYEEIHIPVALISHTDMLDINQRFGEHKQVALFSTDEPLLDYSMVALFLLAVCTVAGGGFWSGEAYKSFRNRAEDEEEREKKKMKITPTLIVLWVSLSCLLLVMLHQFYDYLAYLIIVVFCLCSSVALYSCLMPLLRLVPCGTCRIPGNKVPFFKKHPEIRQLLLAVFCASVSAAWVVFRNEESWAWVLQDTLGVALLLYLLRAFELPSFKACTLLLTLLLAYDVFFVFITPYFTQSGKSIMVEVGTGPTNSTLDEQLPLVLKVPQLSFSADTLCSRVFGILGFGDVMVPGLLVAYCHRFDVLVQSPRAYYLTSTAGYAVGMILTIVCALMTASAQPALLYLVPCSMLSSLMVALCRSELKLFWAGTSAVPSPIPMVPAPQTQGVVTPDQEAGGARESDQSMECPGSPGCDGPEGKAE